MGLVVEYDIECEALPLVGVAAAAPETAFFLELQFNHGPRPIFIVTERGDEQETVETALTDAYDVDKWTLIGEAGDTRRYQAHPSLSLTDQLGEPIDDLAGLEALAREDAHINRIEVQPTGWTQEGWFADEETFHEFRSFWQQHVDFHLRRLTRLEAPAPPGDGLTDRQREALRTAYDMGYFDIPRRTSLEELASKLDISASSVSERLRRAQTQLIEETAATMWPPVRH